MKEESVSSDSKHSMIMAYLVKLYVHCVYSLFFSLVLFICAGTVATVLDGVCVLGLALC